LNNTQKVTEMQRSQAYLEEQLNFSVKNELAYCRDKKCNFHSNNFIEAEEHWYDKHYIWRKNEW